MHILPDHITHASGERKSVCVTACLTALGVPVERFHYTGGTGDNRRAVILRRFGYKVRSRMSRLGRNATTGRARVAIRKMQDPAGTVYMVCQLGTARNSGHMILIDATGKTIVDTAPRKIDKRRVFSIHAVYK